MRNGKRDETGFKKKASIQAMYEIKKAAYFSDVIIIEKIKNKFYSLT